MKWLKRIAVALLVVVVVAAGLALEGGTLKSIFKVGDLPSIDFATLERSTKPNQFVVCPPDLCKAKVDLESPTFDVSVEKLQTAWHDVAMAEPRVELLSRDDGKQRYDYLQRSRLLRYPDIITIQLIATADGGSTFAIYSRSLYGRSDFGVNKARVTDWIAKLQTKLAA